MRRFKKTAIVLGAVAAAFILMVLLTDPLIERQLEKAGSNAVGARVEIDGLDLSLPGLYMKWDSLQVANPGNPWQNIISTGRCRLDFMLKPLFQKKVIIEHVEFLNVVSGTRRSTDGTFIRKRLPPPKPARQNIIQNTIQQLDREIKKAPVWQAGMMARHVNVDSLLTLLDIRSPDKVDSLQAVWQDHYHAWDERLGSADIGADLREISSLVESVRVDKIQTIADARDAVITLHAAKIRSDSLLHWLRYTGDMLNTDLKQAAADVQIADDWVAADIQRAVEKARLPDMSASSVGQYLLGKRLMGSVKTVLTVVGRMRALSQKSKSGQPAESGPSDRTGRTDKDDKSQLPSFWLQHLALSGAPSKNFTLDGEINNIVTNQRLAGKTTTLHIGASRGDGAWFRAEGEIDHLERAREEFSVSFSNIPMASVVFGDSAAIRVHMAKGTAGGKGMLRLSEERVESDVQLMVRHPQISLISTGKIEGSMAGMLQRMLAEVPEFRIRLNISGASDGVRVRLTTNLDEQLSQRLKQMVSGEAEQARKRLIAEVDRQAGPSLRQFKKWMETRSSGLESTLAGHDRETEGLLAAAGAREDAIKARFGIAPDETPERLMDLFKSGMEELLKGKKEEKEKPKQ